MSGAENARRKPLAVPPAQRGVSKGLTAPIPSMIDLALSSSNGYDLPLLFMWDFSIS